MDLSAVKGGFLLPPQVSTPKNFLAHIIVIDMFSTRRLGHRFVARGNEIVRIYTVVKLCVLTPIDYCYCE